MPLLLGDRRGRANYLRWEITQAPKNVRGGCGSGAGGAEGQGRERQNRAQTSKKDPVLAVEPAHGRGLYMTDSFQRPEQCARDDSDQTSPGDQLLTSPECGLRLPALRGRRERTATLDEAHRLIAALQKQDQAVWTTAHACSRQRQPETLVSADEHTLHFGAVGRLQAYSLTGYRSPHGRRGRCRWPSANGGRGRSSRRRAAAPGRA